MTEQQAQQILEGLARVESKIDALLAALADPEDEAPPQRTLDGRPMPGERDQSRPL